jgi:orotate phosphoribosyltransferase
MKTLYFCGMTTKGDNGLKVAEFLLQIKAIELRPEKPFTWASGWKSPIYCDNRKTLSFPKIRTHIRQQFVNIITENYGKPEVIAGVATGGVAIGALVAQELGVPFIYVRSSAKEHGLGNLIEGVLEPGQDVVVIEDLISTGKSSLNAVEAIRNSGGKVKGMVAIFSYGFPHAADAFKKAKCELHTLSDYNILLDQATRAGYISDNQIETLQEWRKDPESWSNNFISELSN